MSYRKVVVESGVFIESASEVDTAVKSSSLPKKRIDWLHYIPPKTFGVEIGGLEGRVSCSPMSLMTRAVSVDSASAPRLRQIVYGLLPDSG
jgi:hypothetical protein